MKQEIVIGSRGSDLALWQAHFVQDQLRELGYASRIQIIVTKGDRIQHLSFDKIEGKGFFTKEIEDALLNQEIDLAVHSLKDLPTTSPDGLTIAALSYREDPRDILLIRKEAYDAAAPFYLKSGSTLGTSSARRKVQARLLQPDLNIQDLRGNVPTRVQKCRDGKYDAILLAAAGLKRLQLDLTDLVAIPVDPSLFVPAPAQGVLGLQIRENDTYLQEVSAKLHRTDVAAAVSVERRALYLFEGGCHMPVGAFCEKEGDAFVLTVAKAGTDADLPVKVRLKSENTEGMAEEAVALANKVRHGKVFISRTADESPLLVRQLQAHGYEVTAEKLIDTQQVSLNTVPQADWYFFVSRNAVEHFAAQYAIPAGVQIAAVGQGTAQSLLKHGYEPHFVGDDTDMAKVASDFKLAAQSGKVLFPLGDRSRRSIQKAISAHFKVLELQVYETQLRPKSFGTEFHAVVLTSPSSAEAYLSANAASNNALFVAMGATTLAYLLEKGVKNAVQSYGFDESALAMTIFSEL